MFHKNLIFTPLIKNPDNSAGPIFHGKLAAEYFNGVKAIRINDKNISLNTSLLSIGDEGEGGTKISTLILLLMHLQKHLNMFLEQNQ